MDGEVERKAREAARREAEKRGREARSLRRKKMGVSALGAALFTVGVVVVLTHTWEEPEQVSGSLAGVREVSFVPGPQAGGGVSPVCGCYRPHFDAWRGVTFAAREVVLSRTGRSPDTEWTISGTRAARGIVLDPAVKRLDVSVVRLRPRGRFEPGWLLGGDLAAHGKVLARGSFHAFVLSLVDEGALHVGLLDPVPIGSWIPLVGSRVALGARRSPFPGAPQVPRILERYPPRVGRRSAGKLVDPQGYPVGDFLGPDLVLWSTDRLAHVPGSALEDPAGGGGVVSAVVIRGSSFSTRVGAVPFSGPEQIQDFYEDARAGRRSREWLFPGHYDSGRVQVALTDPLGRAAYAALRARVLAHPTLRMSPLERIELVRSLKAPREVLAHEVRRVPERDRYPPLPQESGFNVFGPLSELSFHGVHGRLLVGDRPETLSGAADLRLSEVSGLRNSAQEELVAAPLVTKSESASLQFHGVGEVEVNGRPETKTSFFKQDQTLLAALGIALALLSACFGLFAFWREIGARRGAR